MRTDMLRARLTTLGQEMDQTKRELDDRAEELHGAADRYAQTKRTLRLLTSDFDKTAALLADAANNPRDESVTDTVSYDSGFVPIKTKESS